MLIVARHLFWPHDKREKASLECQWSVGRVIRSWNRGVTRNSEQSPRAQQSTSRPPPQNICVLTRQSRPTHTHITVSAKNTNTWFYDCVTFSRKNKNVKPHTLLSNSYEEEVKEGKKMYQIKLFRNGLLSFFGGVQPTGLWYFVSVAWNFYHFLLSMLAHACLGRYSDSDRGIPHLTIALPTSCFPEGRSCRGTRWWCSTHFIITLIRFLLKC